jgi:hypothetical protein
MNSIRQSTCGVSFRASTEPNRHRKSGSVFSSFRIENHLDLVTQVKAKAFVKKHAVAASADDLAVLKFSFLDLQTLDPAYYDWPVNNPTVIAQPLPTRFADAGNLDNTGINGMLAYSAIDSLIAFVNSEVPLAAGAYGISDGKGGFIPNTNVVVDECIPPLFGYQPYESGELDQLNKGYVLYADASGTDYPMYAHNQVFDSADFPAFLQGLWVANGSRSNASPSIFSQSLTVQANRWFGVAGGQTVTVVWCYLSRVTAWENQFRNNPAVASLIATAVSQDNFPHYNTFDTSLTATEINLMANMTAWCVVSCDATGKVFSKLFKRATG